MPQADRLVQRLVDAGDRAAHREAVVGEVPDRIGHFGSMEDDGTGLPLEDVAPVEERPDLLAARRPARRGAVDEALQIGEVR